MKKIGRFFRIVLGSLLLIVCFLFIAVGFVSIHQDNLPTAIIAWFLGVVILICVGILVRKKPKDLKAPTVPDIHTVISKSDLPETNKNSFQISNLSLISHDSEEKAEWKTVSVKLSRLDAEALKFWNKRPTNFIVPQDYSQTEFGRNVKPALKRLLEDGYLTIMDIRETLPMKTIPELKAVLAEYGIKASGKKAEIIQTITESISPQELFEFFGFSMYSLTESGMEALKWYPDLMPYQKQSEDDSEASDYVCWEIAKTGNYEAAYHVWAEVYNISDPYRKEAEFQYLSEVLSCDMSDLQNSPAYISQFQAAIFIEHLFQLRNHRIIKNLVELFEEKFNCPLLEKYLEDNNWNFESESREFIYADTVSQNIMRKLWNQSIDRIGSQTMKKRRTLPKGEYYLGFYDDRLDTPQAEGRRKWLQDYEQFSKMSYVKIENFPKTFQTFQKHKINNSEKYQNWISKYESLKISGSTGESRKNK